MAKKREQSLVPQNHFGTTDRACKRRGLNRHTEWNGEQSVQSQGRTDDQRIAFAPSETGKRRRLNRHTEWNGEQSVQSQGRTDDQRIAFAPSETGKRRRIEWNGEQSVQSQRRADDQGIAFILTETGKRRRIEWNGEQAVQNHGRNDDQGIAFAPAETGKRRRLEWNEEQPAFAPAETGKRRRLEWNEEQPIQDQRRADDQGIAFILTETGKRRRLKWNREQAVQNQRHTMSRPDQGIASFPSRTPSNRSPSEKLTSADNGFGVPSPDKSTESPNDMSKSIGCGDCGSSGDDSGTTNLEPITGLPSYSYRRRGVGEYDSGVDSGTTPKSTIRAPTPKPTTKPNDVSAISKNDDEAWEPAEHDSGKDEKVCAKNLSQTRTIPEATVAGMLSDGEALESTEVEIHSWHSTNNQKASDPSEHEDHIGEDDKENNYRIQSRNQEAGGYVESKKTGGRKIPNIDDKNQETQATDRPSALGTEDTHKRRYVQANAAKVASTKEKKHSAKRSVKSSPATCAEVKDYIATEKYRQCAETVKKFQKCTTWQNGKDKPKFHVIMMIVDEMIEQPHKCENNNFFRQDNNGNESPLYGFLLPDGLDGEKFNSVLEKMNSRKSKSPGENWVLEHDPKELFQKIYGERIYPKK